MLDNDEEVQTIINTFLKNPDAREIIQEFQQKKLTEETIEELQKFLDHWYINVTEEIADEFYEKRLDVYADYPFYRKKFKEFTSESIIKMSEEDYDLLQNAKMVERTIHEGMRSMEKVAESDKKTVLKTLILIQLYKDATKRLIEFILGGGVKTRVGIATRRDKGTSDILLEIWEGEYRRTGIKPRTSDVAMKFNIDAPDSQRIDSKDVLAYVKPAYRRLVRDGKMTVEEVTKRGVNIEKVEDEIRDSTKKGGEFSQTVGNLSDGHNDRPDETED